MKRTKDRGITLVAIIVTIIILLILVGIAIGTLRGEEVIYNKYKFKVDENFKVV